MWVCPTCGEPHEDQFLECWKCVGAEQEREEAEALTESAGAPPAREFRSVGSALFYVAVAFILGMVAGMAVFHRNGASLSQAAYLGAAVGAVAAAIVGVFVWIVFPFKAMDPPSD